MVAPELIKVAAEGRDRWLVTKVNTEELPVLAQRFRVNSIPAFALLKSGREVARQAGAMPAQAIRQFVEQGGHAEEYNSEDQRQRDQNSSVHPSTRDAHSAGNPESGLD